MTGSRRFWKIKTLPVEVEEEEEGSVRVQRGQPTARVFPDKPIVAPNVSPSVCECVHARARARGPVDALRHFENTFYRTYSIEHTFYGPC